MANECYFVLERIKQVATEKVSQGKLSASDAYMYIGFAEFYNECEDIINLVKVIHTLANL